MGKKIMISLIILCGFCLLCSSSYALFTIRQESPNKLSIIGTELNYRLSSASLIDGTITVPDHSEIEIPITLKAQNRIRTKYQLYYEPANEGLEVSYLLEDSLPFGEMDLEEEKTIMLHIENKGNSEVTFKFAVKGSLMTDSVSLEKNQIAIEKEYIPSFSQEFAYMGAVQLFSVPRNGYYQLEAWGASGGDGYSTYRGTGYSYGGLGGYSSGEVYLETGTTIYVYVGGKGTSSGTTKTNIGVKAGGYNGGGSGRSWDNSNQYVHNGAGGGGATDIRTKENDLTSRLIVAGGGGGGSGHEPLSNGGSGGGSPGGNGLIPSDTWDQTSGATSNSGGSNTGRFQNSTRGQNGQLGKGGNSGTSYAGGGGGGGYYGGAGGSWAPGSGGSAYLGGVQNGTTTMGIQSGNGKAKITWLRNR